MNRSMYGPKILKLWSWAAHAAGVAYITLYTWGCNMITMWGHIGCNRIIVIRVHFSVGEIVMRMDCTTYHNVLIGALPVELVVDLFHVHVRSSQVRISSVQACCVRVRGSAMSPGSLSLALYHLEVIIWEIAMTMSGSSDKRAHLTIHCTYMYIYWDWPLVAHCELGTCHHR